MGPGGVSFGAGGGGYFIFFARPFDKLRPDPLPEFAGSVC